MNVIDDYELKILKLENQNKLLKECTEFYADKDNWINSECCTGLRWHKARNTLEQINKMESEG